MARKYLINNDDQIVIAGLIDNAVSDVISELSNHGSEEGITPVLGHALMRQSFQADGLTVSFNYRQMNKRTEEPHNGADGGFLVKVVTDSETTRKATLFQAKLLRGSVAIRQLKMTTADGRRLAKQANDMLARSDEAVVLFYTEKEIYVVDAIHFRDHNSPDLRSPLSKQHRLITLGTYLGRWMPRCTKGDQRSDIVTRVSRQDGFKHGLTMEVISEKPSIPWKNDPSESRWKS